MDLDELEKEGYVLSPYYNDASFYFDEDDFDSSLKVDINEEELKELARHFISKNIEILNSKENVVFFKSSFKYHITPEDVLIRLEEEKEKNQNDINQWIDFISTKTGNGSYFYPIYKEKFIEDYKDDYLFKNNDHIVSCVFALLKENNEEYLEDKLDKCILLLKDLISKKKENYSLSTKYFMLSEISYKLYKKMDIDDDCLSFYRDELIKNAESGEIYSMKLLGYEYYEGSKAFPLDQVKSEYWLEKYFSISKDPDVARTLGYIYYYGRINNGIPQKEKAFQYFAIGHLAGGYFEATYKLADCYIKGYGTPICEQAAYNLVASIYKQNFEQFKVSDSSKFADVALRLGSYYKDGVFVKKDLDMALLYLLQARVAIKKRLENIDYVGDSSVAMSIYKSLRQVEDEIGLKGRVLKDNGYVIPNFYQNYSSRKDYAFKIKPVGNDVELEITSFNDEECMINTITEIGFSEKSEAISLLFKCSKDITDFINECLDKEIVDVDIFKNTLLVSLKDENKSSALLCFDEVIVVPQTFKNSSLHTLVSISPFSNNKLYDYLCEGESIKIGDFVNVATRDGLKKVEVKNVTRLYEDELPMPIGKMGKVTLS